MLAAPPMSMKMRPFVPSHRSSGRYAFVDGAKPMGSVNAIALLPDAIAPWKWMVSPLLITAALRVLNGAFVQPFTSVRGVNLAVDTAKDTPSSEVKHWALENVPFSATT